MSSVKSQHGGTIPIYIIDIISTISYQVIDLNVVSHSSTWFSRYFILFSSKKNYLIKNQNFIMWGPNKNKNKNVENFCSIYNKIHLFLYFTFVFTFSFFVSISFFKILLLCFFFFFFWILNKLLVDSISAHVSSANLNRVVRFNHDLMWIIIIEITRIELEKSFGPIWNFSSDWVNYSSNLNKVHNSTQPGLGCELSWMVKLFFCF